MLRVVVTGGRNFSDKTLVTSVLNGIHAEQGISCLIHGGARGADTLSECWALDVGVPVVKYAAEWDKYGKSAGCRRNVTMLTNSLPDLVVAFPGGRGTEHCVRTARKLHLRVLSVCRES